MNTMKENDKLTFEKDRKTRFSSINIFLMVLYAIISVSICFSIAGTEEVKEKTSELRWKEEIKDCDIYVKNNISQLMMAVRKIQIQHQRGNSS